MEKKVELLESQTKGGNEVCWCSAKVIRNSRCPVADRKKVRMFKEELQLLEEPGSYVGEVVKVMGKSKVLVKVHPGQNLRCGNLMRGIDLKKIAEKMNGASGAELKALYGSRDVCSKGEEGTRDARRF
ncbi:hypothetical protein K7X08_032539 [Anisodus acutangulus]|uniref:Uncharacterized protein n=1 Tax=Anisodus acutangulus TaxID=402998 RepID=A0A9Q1RBQ2_9SOLA|nr:hypothetical protein K7X08_032539 [Anisodus acutangulus]